MTIWVTLLFVPSIILPFTASLSKASPAGGLCVVYLCWRLACRVHPALPSGPFLLAVLLSVYLCLQGVILVAGGSTMLIVLLQGQWVAYFLAGLFLAYDIARAEGGDQFLSSSLVWLCAPAAVCGIVSIWTGPFFSYAGHTTARWGLPINRAVGTFDSPASLSSVLEFAFLLEYFSGRRNSLGRRRTVLVLLAVTLLLTFGKGAIVSCLMVLASGGVLAVWSGRRAHTKAIVCGFLAVLAIAGGIFWLAGAYDIDLVQLIKVDADGHAERRADVLKEFYADDLAPQLFGIGFRQSAKLYSDEMIWYTAHNGYISFLREIGVLGTGVFCILLLCLLRGLFRGGYLPWAAAVIGVLLLAYTETFFYSSYLVLAIGGAIGLDAATRTRYREQLAGASRPVVLTPLPRIRQMETSH